jgi:hypothetical protein
MGYDLQVASYGLRVTGLSRISYPVSRILTTLLLIQISISLSAQTDLSGKEILKRATAASGGDTWQQPATLQLNGNARWTPYGKTDPNQSIYFDGIKWMDINWLKNVVNGEIEDQTFEK